MNPELIKRIEPKDSFTFRECVGLASEFNLKPRYVIALVLSMGKEYVDHEEPSSKDNHPSPKTGS